jgi:hypothetical protein
LSSHTQPGSRRPTQTCLRCRTRLSPATRFRLGAGFASTESPIRLA